MPNLELMTIDEAAALLGESRRTTTRRIESEQLAATRLKKGKGVYVLERSQVIALAEELLAERQKRRDDLEAVLTDAKAAMESAGAAS